MKYECMIVTKGEDENYVDKFADIIKEMQGIVEMVDKWGKKRLAYPIQDFDEALYALIKYVATPMVTKELDRKLKLDENVLRHIIIRTNG